MYLKPDLVWIVIHKCEEDILFIYDIAKKRRKVLSHNICIQGPYIDSNGPLG